MSVILHAACRATSLQDKLLTEINSQLHFAIFSETFKFFLAGERIIWREI